MDFGGFGGGRGLKAGVGENENQMAGPSTQPWKTSICHLLWKGKWKHEKEERLRITEWERRNAFADSGGTRHRKKKSAH